MSLAAFGSRAHAELTVLAAASLKTALDEIAMSWPEPVSISYSASGTIARQVTQGAPADVIVLANDQWMDWLATNPAVSIRSRQNLLSNALVLVAAPEQGAIAADRPGEILRALKGGRLAIGQTQSVPAGIYARTWLENAGLWEDLAPHLAEAENVRAALAFVARKEAPLGLVYASDAVAESRVKIVYAVPPSQYPAIRYPAASLTITGDAFLAFLASQKALTIFQAHGFLHPVPAS